MVVVGIFHISISRRRIRVRAFKMQARQWLLRCENGSRFAICIGVSAVPKVQAAINPSPSTYLQTRWSLGGYKSGQVLTRTDSSVCWTLSSQKLTFRVSQVPRLTSRPLRKAAKAVPITIHGCRKGNCVDKTRQDTPPTDCALILGLISYSFNRFRFCELTTNYKVSSLNSPCCQVSVVPFVGLVVLL